MFFVLLFTGFFSLSRDIFDCAKIIYCDKLAENGEEQLGRRIDFFSTIGQWYLYNGF